MGDRSLNEYNKKRNFDITMEPPGNLSVPGEKPIFVIQKHKARRLHYDFRIEYEGVLLSWAIPKGPSMDPSDKRLAVQTEDHPMDYADFEGVIPEGEYGAGPVIIWDKGVFQNITEKDEKLVNLDIALEKGHISLVLAGEKLKGGFNLVRTAANGKQPQWLLLKAKDPYALPGSNITESHPASVLTGKLVTDPA